MRRNIFFIFLAGAFFLSAKPGLAADSKWTGFVFRNGNSAKIEEGGPFKTKQECFNWAKENLRRSTDEYRCGRDCVKDSVGRPTCKQVEHEMPAASPSPSPSASPSASSSPSPASQNASPAPSSSPSASPSATPTASSTPSKGSPKKLGIVSPAPSPSVSPSPSASPSNRSNVLTSGPSSENPQAQRLATVKKKIKKRPLPMPGKSSEPTQDSSKSSSSASKRKVFVS